MKKSNKKLIWTVVLLCVLTAASAAAYHAHTASSAGVTIIEPTPFPPTMTDPDYLPVWIDETVYSSGDAESVDVMLYIKNTGTEDISYSGPFLEFFQDGVWYWLEEDPPTKLKTLMIDYIKPGELRSGRFPLEWYCDVLKPGRYRISVFVSLPKDLKGDCTAVEFEVVK